MTVANNYAPVVTAATGSAVQFSGTWNAISAAYLVVQTLNISTGVYTTITQGTGSTQWQLISLGSSGFVIQFNTAPVFGLDVIISRDTTPAQPIPYTSSRGFQGSVEEGSFDTLTNMVQELTETAGRSLKFNVGSTSVGLVPEPIDGYGLIWDGTSGTLRNTASSLAVLEGDAAIVAANIAAVDTVASNIGAVITNNANSTNINIVATNIANVNATGANIAAVVSVAGDLTNINAVATDLTAINTVATNIANVNLTGGSITNINSVAGDLTNINNVATDLTNINSVAGAITNINAVAGDLVNINAVAGDLTNINTVSTNISAVNIAATNIASIIAAPAAAALVASAVHRWNFLTAITNADPGTGNIKFDSATPASVAHIYISNLTGDSGNPDLTTFIQTWDDSTNTVRGNINISDAAGNNFVFQVTGAITNNTTWSSIPVTYVSNGGTFTAADALGVGFSRAGDKGINGAGSGNFNGPGSSVANTPVVFADTSGQLGKMANANINLPVASNDAHSTDVASTASPAIFAALGNSMNITGTTTITGFDGNAAQAGSVRRVTFTGALTLTHNATSLILPSAANITTAAGDVAFFEALGTSTNVRCISYMRASGAALVAGATSAVPVAYRVTSASDIALSTAPTQANVGTPQTMVIPINGYIRMSFEGMIVSTGSNAFLTLGIRIGSTNYWPSYQSDTNSLYFAICGGNTTGSIVAAQGHDPSTSNGMFGGPVSLSIGGKSIPTGSQTVQVIAAQTVGATGTIKGTVVGTVVNLEMVQTS